MQFLTIFYKAVFSSILIFFGDLLTSGDHIMHITVTIELSQVSTI